uniref:Avh98b n=1 Tax=Phytophthora sojae TaxID=67593 RepID=G1FRC2_PHYSO|nr:Avh98b [Phytophthora sojae]
MRLSQVLMAIAATFLVAGEALSTATDSNQAKLAQVALASGQSQQRHLRAHPTESEERALDPTTLQRMFKDGVKVDDYAATLGITDDIANAMRNPTALNNLLGTPNYEKYRSYLNYVTKKRNSRRAGRIIYE